MSARNLIFSEGEYYHLYSRGVEKRPLFLDEQDYKRFETLLYSANSNISVHLSNYQGKALLDIPRGEPLVAIGAWCLMPNHFHLLVKEIAPGGVSTFMQKLLTGYSMYFNKKYSRTGSLFERKFNAKHVDSDQYLAYLYAYIHLNPIGIVDKGWKMKVLENKPAARKFVESYLHTSYVDYAGIIRSNKVILNASVFPEYFVSAFEKKKMITEWISFE